MSTIYNNKTRSINRNNINGNTNKTYHKIVAGFPGVGKSTAMHNYPYKFIDMESSYYHWIFDNGEKKCNPEWPNNYIDAIISIATNTFNNMVGENIVAISTHKEVLDGLSARGIYFDAVCPNSKDVYIQRYIDRGSDQAFIDLLQNKFESFVSDVINSNAGIVYFTDDYFANLFYSDTISHSIGNKYKPSKITDKTIVAVWPIGMAATEYDSNNGLIHYCGIESVLKLHGLNQTDTTDDSSTLEYYYRHAIALASVKDAYKDVKFIVVDAYPDVIKHLIDNGYHYMLVTPNTYNKFYRYDCDMVDIDQFENKRKALIDECYHAMVTDIPISVCLNNATKEIEDGIRYTLFDL